MSGSYGLSAMFQGLSQGLEGFAKISNERDMQDKRIAADSAREAANQAFHENLARFQAQSSRDTSVELEGMRIGEQQARDKITDEHYKSETERQTNRDIAADKDRDANRQIAREGLEINRENKKSLDEDRAAQKELRKQQADAAAAAMTRGDAAAAVKIADDAVSVPAMNLRSAQTEYEALVKAGKEPDSPEMMDAKIALQRAKNAVNEAEKFAKPIRDKALKDINYDQAGKPAAPAPATPAPFAKPSGEATAAPSAAAAPPVAAPAPDVTAEERTAYKQRLMADKGLSDAVAQDYANQAPATAVKKLLSAPAPSAAGGAPAAPPTTQTQSFLQPTGQAAGPPTPGLGGGPSPNAVGTPPPATASTPPAAAPPLPGAAPPQAAAAPGGDEASKFESMAANLEKSPSGQAVVTTINRLADAKQGPVADKMRRAAEIQLEQMFPGQDSKGLIDYILDQNAQQPTMAA